LMLLLIAPILVTLLAFVGELVRLSAMETGEGWRQRQRQRQRQR